MLIGKDATWPDYKRKTNVQAWGYLTQAEILGSANIPREEVEEGILDRMRNFKESLTQENRSETNRLGNEMSGRIRALLKQSQSLITEEIDTDEEWETVWEIPEGKLKL